MDVTLPPRAENSTACPTRLQHQAQGEGGPAGSGEEDESQRLRGKVVEHALFVLSNLATGDETVISEVMDSGVPALLPNYLAYSSGDCHSYGAVRSLHATLLSSTQRVPLLLLVYRLIQSSTGAYSTLVSLCCGIDVFAAMCTDPLHIALLLEVDSSNACVLCYGY